MIVERPLHPFQYAQVIGLPIIHLGLHMHSWSGFELLAQTGAVKDADIVHACGESMVQIAVRSIWLFAIGSSKHVQSSSQLEQHGPDHTDPEI